MKTIWQEEIFVKSSDTDFLKRLKVSNFFIWMQDVASNHADELGAGYQEMQKRGLAWVLSRKKARFIDFPQMGEKVTIQTWPKGIQQKLFFMRDHRLTGQDGRILALSTTAYVLISTSARRILPPSALNLPFPDNNGLSAIDEPLEKIPGLEPLSECFSIQAGYSSVDIMEHVNNARYVEWICDCFPLEAYQARRPAALQINYLNEVRPGDRIRLLRGARPENENAWYITGMNENTGAKAFEAEFLWK